MVRTIYTIEQLEELQQEADVHIMKLMSRLSKKFKIDDYLKDNALGKLKYIQAVFYEEVDSLLVNSQELGFIPEHASQVIHLALTQRYTRLAREDLRTLDIPDDYK